jgi:hypothetical protein
LFGGYAVQHVADGWAMPRVALEGLTELIGNEFRFSHKSTTYRGSHGSNGFSLFPISAISEIRGEHF